MCILKKQLHKIYTYASKEKDFMGTINDLIKAGERILKGNEDYKYMCNCGCIEYKTNKIHKFEIHKNSLRHRTHFNIPFEKNVVICQYCDEQIYCQWPSSLTAHHRNCLKNPDAFKNNFNKIVCECGSVINKMNLNRHKRHHCKFNK